MIIVFWRLAGFGACFEEFDSNKMSAALTFMEELRAKRRAGEEISHVCMQSEMPESVGEAGVADPKADYDWRKRREDPATFGRPGPGDDMVEELV